MTAMNYKLLNFVKLKEVRLWDYLDNFKQQETLKSPFSIVRLGEVIKQRKKSIIIDDEKEYKRCRVQLYAKGIELRDIVKGAEIKTKKQQVCRNNDFLVAEIDAKSGGYGIVFENLEGAIVSSHYFLYEIDDTKLLPQFLELYIKTSAFFQQVKAVGSTNYAAIRPSHILDYKIPLPKIDIQKQLVSQYTQKLTQAQEAENQANEIEKNIEDYLLSELGIEKPNAVEKKEGLQFVKFKEINSWSIDKISYDSENSFKNSKKLSAESVMEAFRGKSPKYEELGEAIILNQKCNRWNEIKLEFAKIVNKDWFNSINKKFKTLENDILINSTGDGTIGRSSLVTKGFENLIYDSHILLLRLNQEVINPTFFVYQFNSTFIQNQIEQIKSAQSTKQTELGLDNLFKLNFSIPQRTYDKNGEINIEKDIQTKIANHITTEKEKIKSLRQQAEELRRQAKETFENEIFA